MQVREYPQFRFRLRPEVLEWLKERAARNYRSMNAEVAACLDQIRLRPEQNASPASGGAPAAGQEA